MPCTIDSWDSQQVQYFARCYATLVLVTLQLLSGSRRNSKSAWLTSCLGVPLYDCRSASVSILGCSFSILWKDAPPLIHSHHGSRFCLFQAIFHNEHSLPRKPHLTCSQSVHIVRHTQSVNSAVLLIFLLVPCSCTHPHIYIISSRLVPRPPTFLEFFM